MFPNGDAEAALAHVIADMTEAAYRRGDLFEKRRRMMQAWADFCSRATPANVTALLRVKTAPDWRKSSAGPCDERLRREHGGTDWGGAPCR
jgi:hypothetical protein